MRKSYSSQVRYLLHLSVPRYFSRRTVLVLFLLSQVPFGLWYFLPHPSDGFAPEAEIGIADVIEKVRSELIKSHDKLAKKGEPAMFVVKSFDMEIYYRLKQSSAIKGGTSDIKVFAINAERARETESGQKITIHMQTLGDLALLPPDLTVPTAAKK